MYLYLCIFGQQWGSGHLCRAISFQKARNESVLIHVICQDPLSDDSIVQEYGVQSCDLPTNTSHLTLVNDTLGMFDIPSEFDRKIYLDGLYLKDDSSLESYHILYPTERSKPYDPLSDFFSIPQKNALIVQGGGDDHNTIPKILPNIPSNIFTFVCVGNNCRTINSLQTLVSQYNAKLLVGVPIIQIANGADFVITAGGNTLLELLLWYDKGKISIYTEEQKEHISLNRAFPDKVVKVFKPSEKFYWCFND